MDGEAVAGDVDDELSDTSRGSTIYGWNKIKMSDTDREKLRVTLQQLYLARAKLKAVSRTSALIAGFAMVAMVEVQLSSNVDYGKFILIMFSTVTTFLVSVHLFALMISTCLLPTIEAVSSMHSVKAVENSPHMKMRTYIEVAWILSTGVGLILFLIEIVLLIWLKFIALRLSNSCPGVPNSGSKNCTQIVESNSGDIAAWCGTALLIPVVVIFAGFAFHFYRTLAHHRYNNWKTAYEDIEMMQCDEIITYDGTRLTAVDSEAGYHHNSLSRVYSAASDQITPISAMKDSFKETDEAYRRKLEP